MATLPGTSDASLTNRSPEENLPARGWRERLKAASAYLCILAGASFFYAMAERIQFDNVPGRIGPDFWPKLILGLTIIACLWSSIRVVFLEGAARPAGEIVDQAPELAEFDEPEIYPLRVWAAIFGTLAYIWVITIAGFFLSTFVFLFFIIFVAGYRRLLPVFVLALGGSLSFMIIFVRIVYVSLPLGKPPFDAVSIALLKLLNF